MFPQLWNKLSETKNLNFTQCLESALDLVRNLQMSRAASVNTIHLSFFPMAKNIRVAASFMARNVMEGKRSVISNLGKPEEIHIWEDHLKMESWYPWLWARGRMEAHYPCKRGWFYYFDSFREPKTFLKPLITKPQDIFFVTLACHLYTFTLNSTYIALMDNYAIQMQWPSHAKILALHIRRGDSCTTDGSKSNRAFFTIDEYVAQADKLMGLGFTHVYVATDSNEEIQVIQTKRPNWNILSLPIDRGQFYRMQKERALDVEVICAQDTSKIPFVADTAIADLYFITMCQGYVATITVSEFSRCGWFLQMARQKRITPFINMNGDSIDLTDKLLLNFHAPCSICTPNR